MPIPFLLAGLGVVAGVVGAGGHISAKETNAKAQRISQDAQHLYNSAKRSLEQAQNKTEKALLKLGYEKKHTLDTSMSQFLNSYDKIKHIQVTESIGISEISKFTIDQQGAIEMKQMTDIYSSSIKSGVAGAAAGTVVALAASGSLTIIGSEMALAGSALVAGEVGAAAGIAGSALSFGAAMTPLAAVAAPVILFTGISASMKADENLEKANVMYAQAEEASEKMKVSETLCNAISDRSEMFHELLVDLNVMFEECSGMLAGVIKKKEGRIFKKKLSAQDFSEDDLKLIAVTRSLAGAVKSVIDTPILSKDGNISYEAEEMYDQTIEKLPDFNAAVEEVKQIDYKTKPIQVKEVKNRSSATKSKSIINTTTVLGAARNVFAFVAGIFVATNLAAWLSALVSFENDKYLFMDAFVANKIAFWLVICASIMIVIGKFSGSQIEKAADIASGIGLGVLYTQYCRYVETMNHPIIVCVIVLIIVIVALVRLANKMESWSCGNYLFSVLFVVMGYQSFFGIYAFFTMFLEFSSSFWLVVTSVNMLPAAVVIFLALDK